MSSNIVLECSQFQSSSTTTNEWVSTFSEPLILEDGDVFQLQQAMINTKSVSSGSILIPTDTNVIITVAYYDVAMGTYRIADPKTYNIPIPYGQVPNGIGPSDVQTQYDGLFKLLPEPHSTDLNRPTGYYLLRERAYDQYANFSPNSPLVTQDITLTIPQGSYLPETISSMITNLMVESIDTTICGNTSGILVSKGVYNSGIDYKEQNALVVVPGSEFIQSIDPISNYLINPDSSEDQHQNRLVGASTFTFDYSDNVFSFTNFHTPIMGESVDSGSTTVYTNPSIQYLFPSRSVDSVSDPQVVDCYGGCVITDLQPRWFWNTLGFTDAHIDTNVKFDDAVFQSRATDALKFDYFNKHRVHPRVISGDYRSSTLVGNYWIKKLWASVPNPLPPHTEYPRQYHNQQFVQSDDTFALSGNENYIVDDSGYYRIEAVAEFSNDFKMEDGRLGAVIGVVSKNYNSNDFITGYGADSGIAFQHVGVPQSISSVKIRIIDPKTNLPVEGLGSNSTVFLELVKAPPSVKGKE